MPDNDRSESVKRMLEGEDPPEDTVQPGASSPPREDAKMAPEGVGESTSRSGEDIAERDGKEAGRHDEGTEGEADRPVGTSDPRDGSST